MAIVYFDGCDAAVSSRLAYPQVCAALAAAGRNNRLDAADQRRAEADWEGYWASTRPVELAASITVRAGQLADQYALSGAGSVHLASLLAVGISDTVFAVWDQRLRAGAHAAGVRLAPAP